MDPTAKTPESIKVEFLGPLGTYSHQAVLKFSGKGTFQLVPQASIREVVLHGAQDARLGHTVVVILPIENSTQGIVHEALESLTNPHLFSQHGLRIVDEIDLTVAHALIVKSIIPNSFESIKEVHSHEQALGQCEKFLNKYLPHALRIPSHSTAEAVAKLNQSPPGRVAAIASELCAEMFGMPVLAKSIQMTQCMSMDHDIDVQPTLLDSLYAQITWRMNA